jgi:heme/copper-type cytochrome/quinol oxidase subunit 1
LFSVFRCSFGARLSWFIRLSLRSSSVTWSKSNAYHDFFNAVVTNHALMMIFFFIMPALIGFFGN